MITLFKFGPAFGLPDASPFCMKSELQLKFAKLDYQTNHDGFKKAPKGKLPYIDDDGQIIADSSFIRFHIEQKYGFDFDAGLNPRATAIAWSMEKMVEDHLYWFLVHERWLVDENFDRGPSMFFNTAPAIIRPVIVRMVRSKVKKGMIAQGLGRHSRSDLMQIAERSIGAISNVLGDNRFIAGDHLSGADAAVFSMLESARCPVFDTPLKEFVNARANLVTYCDAMKEQWFSD